MQHIDKAASATKPEIQEILNLEADLCAWIHVLGGRPEGRELTTAHQDFGLSFYAAMSGLYRQAFAGLRSFLEVSAGSIYLSAFEFKRRRWISGKLDLSWSTIVSPDEGIYSTSFLEAFCSQALSDRKEMLENLRKSYRRCSEYIHGDVATSQLLPVTIVYSPAVFMEWISTSGTILKTLTHALMVRYYNEFDDVQRERVEGSLEDSFGHLESVRTLLGLPLGTV